MTTPTPEQQILRRMREDVLSYPVARTIPPSQDLRRRRRRHTSILVAATVVVGGTAIGFAMSPSGGNDQEQTPVAVDRSTSPSIEPSTKPDGKTYACTEVGGGYFYPDDSLPGASTPEEAVETRLPANAGRVVRQGNSKTILIHLSRAGVPVERYTVTALGGTWYVTSQAACKP